MKRRLFGIGASTLAVMLAGFAPAILTAEDDVNTPRYLIVQRDVDVDGVVTIDAQPTDSNSEQDAQEPEEKKEMANKYWIGVKLRPVDESLRAQLDLPEDVGMVVDSTFEGSPAAEAGMKRNDIVLAVGEQQLSDAQKLIEQVEKSGGKELVMKVLRKGDEKTLKVTPAPHPHQTGSDVLERDDVITWLQDGVDPQKILRHPVGVRLFDRAIVLPHGQSIPRAKLPKGMSVTVHREGSEPAKITVKEGEQEWNVSENELDELPANIRGIVEPLIHPAPFRIRLDGPQLPGKAPAPPKVFRAPGRSPVHPPRPAQRPEPDVKNRDRQLEELSRQLNEMQRAINELRRDRDSEERDSGE